MSYVSPPRANGALQPASKSEEVSSETWVFLDKLHRSIDGLRIIIRICKSDFFHQAMSLSGVLQVLRKMRRIRRSNALKALGYESDAAALESCVEIPHRARRIRNMFEYLDADHCIESPCGYFGRVGND